ncbi:cytochrome P450 [Streptomyces clavuligerus]|uniref:Cytochrome P450-like enzyme n=1 Tax=Streptomyces clavuligerus TaxID=1901 RepID=B5H3R3_STRCL|nr:cytochrome P450 [Streptomyces clavuligerus]ANW21314.1 monooxygenase [Streptomyces clavuligerus]AXU15941.1 cytochrome P450 [Streptomyces clavuligerus]EDY53209.1 NocL [Streptomyces clavuligerus]EFG05562.1 cytochrome P450-like enzyme [Streptomyces clavuligerus]MBY6306069.1 cytochrome P450 [Streptomyces clavuligerus]
MDTASSETATATDAAAELQYPFPRPSAVQVPPVYDRLRGECPVAKVRLPSGDDGYVVSRYDDVRTVLADPRFSRAAMLAEGAPRLTAAPPMGGSLFTMDPPEHTRLRRLVSREFTARRVQNLRPRIQEMTDELLDGMEKLSPPVDLNPAFAFPLPVMVICELLGVPFEDRDRFRGWSDAFVSLTSHTPEEVMEQRMSMVQYLGELVQRKRAEPTDDLMGALVQVHDEDGGRLSEIELITMGITLLVAGHETTVSMIGTCALTLLRHPEHLAALKADPGSIDKVVEELLRINPIGDGGPFRVTLEDVEVADSVIPQGSGVIAAVCSANQDSARFGADPGVFDPSRPTASAHLAFGHGPHFCLGAALARAELQIALSSLFRRFPGLALADEVRNLRMTSGMMVHALSRLPVTW